MKIIEAKANGVAVFINLDAVARMSVARPTEDQLKAGEYKSSDRLIKVVFNNGDKGEYTMNRGFHKALVLTANAFKKGEVKEVEVAEEAAE